MKSRILYIGKHIGFAGGIERYAFQTARLLRSSGAVVDYAGDAPARDDKLFADGFDAVRPIASCDGDYDIAVLHKLCPVPQLESLLKRFGGRLVFLAHDHDLYCPRRHYYTPFGRTNCHRPFAPFRCLLCSMATKPSNWSATLSQNNSGLLKLLSRQHAVVLSSFMRNNLIINGFHKENIHVVHPFVECGEARTDFCPDGRLRILFLGQLIRGKGADLLLDALSRIRVPFEATVAGDGNDRAMLEAMAGARGLSGVRFTGWLAEPEKAFADADVLAFPSRWQEPFGLSGVEAMAHGVPVAGFNVGGVEEWLHDGRNGVAVPEADAAAMASALESLARNPSELARMSGNCVELVKQEFSPARFLESFERLQELVGGL